MDKKFVKRTKHVNEKRDISNKYFLREKKGKNKFQSLWNCFGQFSSLHFALFIASTYVSIDHQVPFVTRRVHFIVIPFELDIILRISFNY